MRALPGISQVAESPTASTGFGSRNNGKREQRGFTATRRRLHWLVVAAFTDNTESTVYRGALWNYEDGTEDGWRRKRKRARRRQRWIASNIGGLNEDRMFASRFVFLPPVTVSFHGFSHGSLGSGAKTFANDGRGVKDKGEGFFSFDEIKLVSILLLPPSPLSSPSLPSRTINL